MHLNEAELPRFSSRFATSALTIAELAAGPHAASDDLEKERRRSHLRRAEANIEVLSFDVDCARAYGLIYASVNRAGRKPRGSRAVDLMIAATALAHDLALYTLNPQDLRGLEDLVEIVDLGSQTDT